jgi:cytochrome c-type biogenesis protein CcmH
MRRLAALTLLAWALAGPVLAVQPDEMLSDPALEARARAISQKLRCLVCQNQSIDDSEADLARDLRLLVRERLKAGDSDQATMDFVVARYGDFVLLDPPFKMATIVLWLGPAALGLIGLGSLAVYYRRRRGEPARPAPLSEAERQRLDKLLAEGPDGGDAR